MRERERAQKKTFQQSLEDIKERMKEKRNKRLANAAAPSMGRSRIINKTTAPSSAHTILKGVQQNNKALAVALQAEKEKVRQANGVILQLKREQQAMFLHLLLLKRKLKEQEALAISASQNGLIYCDEEVTLPSTVGVRRRNANRRSRRQSERVQEQRLLSNADPVAVLRAIIPSPIRSDSGDPNQNHQGAEPEAGDVSDTEELHHSTPEPVRPKKTQPQPGRKQTQPQPRSKREPTSRKPDRGRKPDRVPLKKPWENPKPRARSKSRDRSATRSKAAPPPQSNKLNTSLGFNDTFDFDCEETVHITPFKAKAEENQPTTPINEENQAEVSGAVPKQSKSSSSSPSSESEDSLYVPQKTRWRRSSPVKTKVIATRRGRHSQVVRKKENIPPTPEISIFRDEESNFKVADSGKSEHSLHLSPDSSFSNCQDPVGLENHQNPQRDGMEGRFPAVSPLFEAEVMRIDTVLSNFGEPSCEGSSLSSSQKPRLKTCQKRGAGVRSAGRGLSLCDVTNMSPAAYRNFPAGPRRFFVLTSQTPAPDSNLKGSPQRKTSPWGQVYRPAVPPLSCFQTEVWQEVCAEIQEVLQPAAV
ncbi:hypothetical protein CRENBAI_026499 [Crenichthys baileyi]|uniref:Shugoshin C-terminal domain-containing protein n=1 Tax=Crenichthys baileyi TaxID=28760 RepID=A0AAV9R5L3_9TELE